MARNIKMGKARMRSDSNMRGAGFTVMGVQINTCHQNMHIVGVCSHPGSKPNLKKRQERRRAKNRVAKHSRRNNR